MSTGKPSSHLLISFFCTIFFFPGAVTRTPVVPQQPPTSSSYTGEIVEIFLTEDDYDQGGQVFERETAPSPLFCFNYEY